MPATDSTRAKLCPSCGRFMTRAKVGRGVDFQVDRCAGCSGIWLDAHEWDVLRARGLHDDVHFVFSSAWQASVAEADRQAARDRLLLEMLGEADLAEVRRVKAWIDGHPRRRELMAFLMNEQG